MKRLLGSILISILLVAAGSSAHAGGGSVARQVEVPYSEPAIGAAGVGVCRPGISCIELGTPRNGEKYLAVGIGDDLSPFTAGSVIQDTNGDGNYLAADDLTTHFCDETFGEAIKLKPGAPVSVWVWPGPGAAPFPCPGIGTSGLVTAVFLKKR